MTPGLFSEVLTSGLVIDFVILLRVTFFVEKTFEFEFFGSSLG